MGAPRPEIRLYERELPRFYRLPAGEVEREKDKQQVAARVSSGGSRPTVERLFSYPPAR